MNYLKTETVNGAAVPERTETVDEAWVERYTSARGFFEGLGGTEVHTHDPDTGVITVKSTSPDRAVVRFVTFTPVEGS